MLCQPFFTFVKNPADFKAQQKTEGLKCIDVRIDPGTVVIQEVGRW
jgi:hypothetical protein